MARLSIGIILLFSLMFFSTLTHAVNLELTQEDLETMNSMENGVDFLKLPFPTQYKWAEMITIIFVEEGCRQIPDPVKLVHKMEELIRTRGMGDFTPHYIALEAAEALGMIDKKK